MRTQGRDPQLQLSENSSDFLSRVTGSNSVQELVVTSDQSCMGLDDTEFKWVEVQIMLNISNLYGYQRCDTNFVTSSDILRITEDLTTSGLSKRS